MLLRVTGLEVTYGPVPAVAGVALEVPEGEIRAILGANGAGKSSTIKAILGLLRARAGTIEFEGRPIHGLPTHRIHQLGIAWVPEGRQLFSTLTVHENLEVGAFARGNSATFQAKLDEVFSLFPRLRERRAQVAGSLSGGEQQMLAIARALMAEPKLLLMDEPSLGLAPKVVHLLFRAASPRMHTHCASTACPPRSALRKRLTRSRLTPLRAGNWRAKNRNVFGSSES